MGTRNRPLPPTLVLKRKIFFGEGVGLFFPWVISLGRIEFTSFNLVIKIPRTYEKLTVKVHIHTSCCFFICIVDDY